MKMIRMIAIGVGLVLAGLSTILTSAQAARFFVLSLGQESCGEFLAADEPHQRADIIWMLGYITGTNSRATIQSDREVGTSFHDLPPVIAWVKEYCQKHGFDVLPKAAEALRIEFANREGQ